VQLCSEPAACACDTVLAVLKDVLMLAGQRTCPFRTSLLCRCLLPRPCVPGKGFVAGSRSYGQQHPRGSNVLEDLAESELWGMSSPSPGAGSASPGGAGTARRWWGQPGFLSLPDGSERRQPLSLAKGWVSWVTAEDPNAGCALRAAVALGQRRDWGWKAANSLSSRLLSSTTSLSLPVSARIEL